MTDWPTPTWERDGHRLYLGDCLEILPTLPDGAVDAVVTDPPYQSLDVEVSHGTTTRLVGLDRYKGKRLASKEGKSWFSTLSDESVRGVIGVCRSITGDSGATYVFGDVKTGLRCFAGAKNVLVWDKCRIGMGYSWRRMHEWIAYFPGEKHRLRRKDMGDIIRVRGVHKKLHPTEKPYGCISPILENSTDVGDTVLDPFFGVGVTGVACARLGRKFVGIEIDEKYFEIAVKRIEKEIAQGKLFQ